MGPTSAISARPLRATVHGVRWPEDVEEVFLRLARARGCVWLDSAGGPADLSRWSVLAAEPSAVLICCDGATRLVAPSGATLLERQGSPFQVLAEVLAAHRLAGETETALPYGPGLYGYLSYDLAPYVEPKAALAGRADIPLPELWFGLYEAVLVLDYRHRNARLVGAPGPAWEAIDAALASAEGGRGRRAGRIAPQAVRGLACNMTPGQFRQAVAQARRYIAAGDIYQVNLSRRYRVALEPPAGGAGAAQRWVDLYMRLRSANPAPYAAYVDVGEGRAVLSSSPELFLDLHGGRIVTRPIKGTRPLRPGDEAFNRRMRDELAASEKDRAELVMIVDLERNDLGRVAAYGSVRVTEPRVIEPYAAVHHTVATVEGRLHADRDLVDLLKATFPGGSITGAPKVRAMQIIAELEPTRRSVYTGAVGYLGPPSDSEPAGRCGLNIAIRTLIAAGDEVHIQVGGGIVADSDPKSEFEETADKARALLAALALAP
jgi:para-aminobenzoate synthetase component 1